MEGVCTVDISCKSKVLCQLEPRGGKRFHYAVIRLLGPAAACRVLGGVGHGRTEFWVLLGHFEFPVADDVTFLPVLYHFSPL